MKSWYQIKSMSDNVINISIHDEIGYWGISAKDFIDELKNHTNVKAINLSIHSPGGEMIDGFAIYNTLKSHPAKIHAQVAGVAASMASVILMAADTISMPENAFIMIHNPSGGAWGGSEDLRHMADLMDKFQSSAVKIYQERTGLEESELVEMLDQETWLNGIEAMEKGFVDSVTDSVDIAAKSNAMSKHFKSMPTNYDNGVEKIENIKDFERFLRDAGGLSRGLATALTSRAKSIFQGDLEVKDSAALKELEATVSKFKHPKW